MKKFLIAVTEGHLLLDFGSRSKDAVISASSGKRSPTIISPEVSVVSELRDLNLEDFIV